MGQIHIDYALNGIEGLCTIMPAVHGDSRGYFMETWFARENQLKFIVRVITWTGE